MISGFCGTVGGALYALATIDFPPGTQAPLAVCMLLFVGLASALKRRLEHQALKMLKQVTAPGHKPSRTDLAEAVREVARLPDLSFWANLGFWCTGSVAIGVTYAQVFSSSLAVRIAFLGVSLGPLVSTLGYLGIVARARVVIEALARAGLTPREVVEAIPPSRLQLQRRLMIYGAVATATPMLLVIDMLVQRTERTFARVLEQSTSAAQSASLVTELDSGLGLILAVAAVAVGVVMIFGYASGSMLGSPMQALAARARAMVAGRLGGAPLVAGEDETWAAVAGFATLETQLLKVVLGLQQAGQKIQQTTDTLAGSQARQESGAAHQSAALAQTSATTEELARSAKQIALNATQVSALATQTLSAARQGKQNADQFYGSILKVREGNQAIADSVVKLNKRVQQVGRIVEFIDGIADKSDLLALNAELEGNKAGEVGRGFSLVAAEMRRLAESVMTSTREIVGLIEEVRDATNAAVMATEAGVKASDSGSALAQRVSEGLSDILEYATTTVDAVQRITLATQQQQIGTDQLAVAMHDILRSTRAGESAAKKMSAANEQLHELATELELTVGRYEVD